MFKTAIRLIILTALMAGGVGVYLAYLFNRPPGLTTYIPDTALQSIKIKLPEQDTIRQFGKWNQYDFKFKKLQMVNLESILMRYKSAS
jgi:hypothetical protein